MMCAHPMSIEEIAIVAAEISQKYPSYLIEFNQSNNSGIIVCSGSEKVGTKIIDFDWEEPTGAPFIPDTTPIAIIQNQRERERRWGVCTNRITSVLLCVPSEHQFFCVAENIIGLCSG